MRIRVCAGVVAVLGLALSTLAPWGEQSEANLDPPPTPPAPVVAAPAPVVAAAPPAVQPPEPDPVVLPGDGVPAVQMSYCEEAGCELTFTFATPTPAARVVFEPAQSGKQVWRSPTELVFTPAKGALLPGHTIRVTIDGMNFDEQLEIPKFTAAGKVADWPVEAGKPRFVAFLNGFVSHIGKGPLFALYDQPVDPAAIGRTALVTRGPTPIGVRVRRPATTAQIYDEPIDVANVVMLELDRSLPEGEQITVDLPSLSDDGKPARHIAALTVNTTLVASAFSDGDAKAERVKGQRTPLVAQFIVKFSNEVTAKQFAKHVSVVPAPTSMTTWVYGAEGGISAELAPGVLYKLAVSDGLHDVLGNRLSAPIVASFRAQDREPALVLPEALVLEGGRAKLPVQVTNVGAATLVTQRFAKATDWLAARAAGAASCTGDERAIDLSAPLNQTAVREVALEPGLLCVSIKGAGRGSEGGDAKASGAAFVQVARAAVTAKVFDKTVFAWVTGLADGKPIANKAVALVDAQGVELVAGTTAADGTVRLDGVAAATATGISSDAFLVVGDSELVAPLAESTLSHARQFGLDGRVADHVGALAASLFTERGVYRPGEQVHVRAFVRDPSTHRPATGALDVVIYDPRGEEFERKSAPLDEYGGATLELALREDAAVGEYRIRAAQGDRAIARTFRVEEYRVPTFAVTVGADAPWVAGAKTHAAVAASYLHGGALAGRELTWEIKRTSEPFAPAGYRGFVFDALDAFATPGTSARAPESLAHGKGRLDGQGHFLVKLAPDHGSKAGPMRYSVDAAVTDVDRQVYAGVLTRVVHAADAYLGVRPPSRRVVTAGETVKVPIAAVALDGTPRANVAVTATLERVDYHSATRLTGEGAQRIVRPVTTAQKRCAIATRAAPVECSFVVDAAGEYVVRAAALDRAGRPIEAAFRVTASGDNEVAWPRFDHERIQIIADQPSYRPGDVARLIIQSPFARATGLLAIERDGVIEHRLFAIDGNTPELRVPITAAHVPNVYASVTIVRGRIHDAVDATGFATGAPAFRMGYAELRVEPRAHQLAVEVTAPATAFPGTKVGVDLVVRDADGAPRAGRATVMVVDEAVLGLTRYRTPDPVTDMFSTRPLAVRTADSRLDLLMSRRSRREQVFPAGDGGDGEQAAEGLEGPQHDLRRLFKATAFYNASVDVGADGRAHVDVALPDNVTTYRIMAIAVDQETRAGAGQAALRAHKPLIVQPALPRFVRPGDRLQLEARAFNHTGAAGAIALTATLEGVAATGAVTSTAQAAAGSEAKFAFPIRVPDDARGVAHVRFAAALGAHRDAVAIELPILDPGTTRKVVASKLVRATETLTLPVPADRRAGSVAVEITTSTTPLSELKDAVEYVMTYPNGCIEQTTSTAYPLLVLDELLPEIGVTVDDQQLRAFSEAGVKRILSFQTTSGGLSYWPGEDKPHAFGTAFGLTALIEAKRKGYEVPDAALGKMAAYLEATLRSGAITSEMPHGAYADADTRAFFVMTLGRLGRPQPSYVSALWDKRDQLTPFGMAFLAVAVSEGAGDPSLLPAMLAAVKQAATEKPLEAYYTAAAKDGWSFDSPLRTHAGALLAFAGANTDGAMSSKLLTGLLARRVDGMWGNTQENVFGMMAIARLVKRAGTDKPEFKVAINGAPLDPARIQETGANSKRIALSSADVERGDQLAIQITNGGKPVFATVRMTYIAKLDAANRAPTRHGFAVTRAYETVDGAALGPKIKLGSLVRVRLRVQADKAQHYVAIDDKLPAGLEPLNAALATSETVAAGAPTPALRRGLAKLSYSELRDARVAFFVDDMPAGTYEFVYVARATTPGAFVRPAAAAEAMYETTATGTSAIDEIVVE